MSSRLKARSSAKIRPHRRDDELREFIAGQEQNSCLVKALKAGPWTLTWPVALELGANRPIAHALLVQLPGQSDGLGALLGMRFSALALVVALGDAFAGKPQLGDRNRLIDLRDRAEDLADERRRRRVLDERAGAIGGDDLDALRLEHAVPALLRHQIAGKPVGLGQRLISTATGVVSTSSELPCWSEPELPHALSAGVPGFDVP
jgi:hypothetical protein